MEEHAPSTILWSPPSHGAFVVGDVLVQLWEHHAPASAFRAIESHCQERKRAHPERPLWMVAVSSERADLPNAAAREVATRFPRYFDGFVLVAEGSRFRAVSARALMDAMVILARIRSAAIASNVREGCASISQQSRGAVDPDTLAQCIHRERARLLDR